MRAHPERLRRASLTFMIGWPQVERAEIEAAEAIAPVRESFVVRALGQASEAADQPPLIAITAGVMVLGLITRNARLARTGRRMLAAELVATALKGAVKHRVDRTRPHVVADGGNYTLRPGQTRAPEYNSFPSGHTAGAVAVARAIVRDRPAARPFAYSGAAVVAAIQIPRCKHYPTDLAAGAAIGLAAEWLVDRTERVFVSLFA